jgi:hypothetical protein
MISPLMITLKTDQPKSALPENGMPATAATEPKVTDDVRNARILSFWSQPSIRERAETRLTITPPSETMISVHAHWNRRHQSPVRFPADEQEMTIGSDRWRAAGYLER